MTNCPFCNLDPPSDSAAPPPAQPGVPPRKPVGLLRRLWHGLQWLLPSTLLMLMPKCPMCIAAYLTLFTGIGVTTATATWIRLLLLAFCTLSLAYLALKQSRKLFLSRRSP